MSLFDFYAFLTRIYICLGEDPVLVIFLSSEFNTASGKEVGVINIYGRGLLKKNTF